MAGSPPLVVALEGGGSKTVALAVDLSGEVVAWGRGGASLSLYVGDDRSTAAIEQAVDAVAGSIEPAGVVAVAGAMVGKGYAADPWAVVRAHFPGAICESMPEGDAALLGATLERVGAVVLSGTGAFGRAVGGAGRAGHVGGNGPLVGDEGSGHYIAVEAIRQALWSVDGRGEPTALGEVVCRHFDLRRLGWIIGRLYGRDALGRHEIASLAPAVVATARDGDAVATSILDTAAHLLADQVVAAIRRVWAQDDGWPGAIPLGCTGGVLLGSPELRRMVAEHTRPRVPDVEPREPRLPPVGGVALHGLQAAGVTLDEALVDRLATSIPPEAGGVPVVRLSDPGK